MQYSIQCNCGMVQGHIAAAGICNRVICYCKDCQAFANHLKRASSIRQQPAIMDKNGGTEIIQMSPSRIKIIAGNEQIKCLRLTEKGLLRWYADCCNTPLGNTIPNYKISFVGLIHSCMKVDSFDESFGRIRARISTSGAIFTSGTTSLKSYGGFRTISLFIIIALSNRLNGKYKNTPFFQDNGEPTAKPIVLEQI